MLEFSLKKLPNGQILCEMEGEPAEVSTLICEAMIKNIDVASLITGAIPTFLDVRKIERAGFCEQIMNGKGMRP